MGNCALLQYSSNKGNEILKRQPSTAKVIHIDGSLEQIRQPIRAGNILSRNPNCFLCLAESMQIDSCLPHVPEDQELQMGHIYFTLPVSKSRKPLSLQELCGLAIKAATALALN